MEEAMDNFMDKLAQKFNAQEMIKANLEAEENEMKKMKLQISEYEKILQEMRKLNYKNTEMSEKLDLMIGETADKLQSIKSDEQRLLGLLRDITDEQTRNIESDQELRQEEIAQRSRERELRDRENQEKNDNSKQVVSELTQFIDNKFQSSDDFSHKENVKVYRNVQAVVVDELKRYNDAVSEEHNLLQKRITAATWVGSIAAVASICNIIIWIVVILINSGII
jgi:Fe-S cluster assembly scaffold protein SufB